MYLNIYSFNDPHVLKISNLLSMYLYLSSAYFDLLHCVECKTPDIFWNITAIKIKMNELKSAHIRNLHKHNASTVVIQQIGSQC